MKKLMLASLIGLGSVLPMAAEADAMINGTIQGPNHPHWRMEEGYRLFAKRDFSGAAESFERVVMMERRNARGWYNLGLAQMKLGRFDQALHSFHVSGSIEAHPFVNYHMSLALFQAGRVLEAIETLEDTIANGDADEYTWTLLGRGYETYQRLAIAKTCYEKALAIDPELEQPRFLLERLPTDLESAKLPSRNQRKTALADTALADESLAEGGLPKSRVLGGFVVQESSHPDLIPLTHTYHVSSDAPGGVKLEPSEIRTFMPVPETTGETGPSTSTPEAKVEVESPSLIPEDL